MNAMWVSITYPGSPVKLVVPFEFIGMNQWVQICNDPKFRVTSEVLGVGVDSGAAK